MSSPLLEEALESAAKEQARDEKYITFTPSESIRIIRVKYPQTDMEILGNCICDLQDEVKFLREELSDIRAMIDGNNRMLVDYSYRLQKKISMNLNQDFDYPKLNTSYWKDNEHSLLGVVTSDADDIHCKADEIDARCFVFDK